MSMPAAMVGAQTRLSTYMIVSRVFGNTGSKLVNVVLALVLLGWYAVTAELFGRTCYLTLASYLPPLLPQWGYTVASSVLVTATTVFGFRAIDRLSLAVAPLLVSLTALVAWRAGEHASWSQMLAVPGTHADLPTGISAVIGGMIVNVVLMPDITRYSRSTLDCALISVAGNGLGAGAAIVLAMLPALAFHEIDPMKYMATLGLVGVAFMTLVVSTWTINAVNLYSTGLVTSTALRGLSYGRIVVGCGVFGTVLAVVGIADRLIDFLVLLGLVVPPIAAVYLTDFFVLNRRDYSVAEGDMQTAATSRSALFAALAGGVAGVLMYRFHLSPTGVPSIEAFLVSSATYGLAEVLRLRLGRNRRWRLTTGDRTR
jgi:cytosine permease